MTRRIDRVHEQRIRKPLDWRPSGSLHVVETLVTLEPGAVLETSTDELRDALGLPPELALTFSPAPVVVTVVVKGPQPATERP